MTEKDIESAIDKVEKTINGVERKDIYNVMQRLTQFANYKSFPNLVNSLKKDGVSEFYRRSNRLSIGSALHYSGELRKNFSFNMGSYGKQAIILDESMLQYLENMKRDNYSDFKTLMESDYYPFYILDGFNSCINIFNADMDIATISSDILLKAKKKLDKQDTNIETMTEAVNKSINEETIQRILQLQEGTNFNFLDKVKVIQTDNIKEAPTSSQIAKQLNPLMADKNNIESILKNTVEIFFPDNKAEQRRAKELLTSYFENKMQVYSPKRMAVELKNLHQKVLKEAGKENEDKVYYVIPQKGHSFEQIAYQYAIVNKIPFNKFIYNDGICLESGVPKDAIIVLLDDVVGSGESLASHKFEYCKFTLLNPDVKKILFAPLICAKQGYDKLNSVMKLVKRSQDKVILGKENILNNLDEDNFYKNLSDDDKEILDKIIGYKGWGESGMCSIFPYMGPDTNTSISRTLAQFFVFSPDCIRRKNIYNDKLYENLENTVAKENGLHINHKRQKVDFSSYNY